MGKAFIWDLDGTLLDSYDVIVESLYLTLKDFGAQLSREEIHRYAITFSSSALIEKIAGERNLEPELLYDGYRRYSREKYHLIKPMPHAFKILDVLSACGAEHYVFTHRGKTTLPVLEQLGMDAYFREVLTSQSGFARKPAPDAINYLVEKYGLDKENTYYVGDRTLDMESAKNAGIPGILFLRKGSHGAASGAETYIVRDLMQILDII